MCGISGIYNLNKQILDIDSLKQFTDSMLHRGPDGSGVKLLDSETLGLGQRRLAILDLSDSGKQPMSYANGRFQITYNGEIFNFTDIKEQLKKVGHVFQSETDTEVILAAYMEWGPLCLKKFNGMWAFAIWDDLNKELFLARDRFGIKPLYYIHEVGNRFAFASETRAFKYLVNFKRSINDFNLSLNIADPYAIEGLGHTIFNDIFQLLPGHFMVVKRNEKVSQTRWWSIDDCHPEIPTTFEDQAEKFYEIFRDACRIRLISDVPIATALSGGLDSTAVYSTVFDIIQRETLGRTSKDSQRAFTVVFPGMQNDESEYAKIASKYTGGEINFVNNDIQNLGNKIERETKLCDFLSNNPITAISSVYEGMRNSGIKVSLDGHGVDEMLYGYRDMVYSLYSHSLWSGSIADTELYKNVLIDLYHPESRIETNEKFKKQIIEKRQRESSIQFKLKKVVRKGNDNSEYMPSLLPSLSNQSYDFSNKPLQDRMVYFEFFQHTLPTLLRNFDRAGMINGVEIRMPFMDWRLVSYVFNLPLSSKIGGGYTKRIVREAMKNRMDESLRTRTFKVGISSPIETWVNGQLKSWTLDHINDIQLKTKIESELKQNNIISRETVSKAWQKINLKFIQD